MDNNKKLNFGCGHDIKDGFDNIDVVKRDKRITKTFDFNKLPYPIKDNTYSYIFASQILEHLFEPNKVLMELWRISKKNSIIEIIVPYYTNKSAYTDMEHKTYFSDVSFAKLDKKFWEKNVFPGWEKETYYFNVMSIILMPTKFGKFIPKSLREKLSLFMSGLINGVHVKLEVLK